MHCEKKNGETSAGGTGKPSFKAKEGKTSKLGDELHLLRGKGAKISTGDNVG